MTTLIAEVEADGGCLDFFCPQGTTHDRLRKGISCYKVSDLRKLVMREFIQIVLNTIEPRPRSTILRGKEDPKKWVGFVLAMVDIARLEYVRVAAPVRHKC